MITGLTFLTLININKMKTKTINKIITEEVDEWIASIKEEIKKDSKKKAKFGEKFSDEIRPHIIVTGGCITSMLLNEEPNDFDVYIDDMEICKKVAEFYRPSGADVVESEKGIKFFSGSIGRKLFEKDKSKTSVKVLCVTDNAITLSNNIQIITRFVGNPEEVHKNFDFVHTKNYWHQEKLVLNPESIESILTKELKYVGSLYPVSSIFRMKKFVARGWSITAGEMLKIAWDVSKLDLEDVNVLKQQLVGVDISYFLNLVEKLENRDKGATLDRNYLFNLIEEVFNT